MKLRQWQAECVGLALDKFVLNQRHFLCLATPGAGKTIMAAQLVKQMFMQNQIDYVLCFSPSIVIANEIHRTMEKRIGQRFDGMIGALGASFTYQTMQYLSSDLWHLLKTSRVLVIFDEIHHCAGSSLVNVIRTTNTGHPVKRVTSQPEVNHDQESTATQTAFR